MTYYCLAPIQCYYVTYSSLLSLFLKEIFELAGWQFYYSKQSNDTTSIILELLIIPSAIPPFRHSVCHYAIPPFRHSAIPPIRHSAIPPFRHSAIPPFRHSTIPVIRSFRLPFDSAIPSAVPPFLPLFLLRLAEELHQQCDSAACMLASAISFSLQLT